jgi:hypothetical protein
MPPNSLHKLSLLTVVLTILSQYQIAFMGNQISQAFPPEAKLTEKNLPDQTGKVHPISPAKVSISPAHPPNVDKRSSSSPVPPQVSAKSSPRSSTPTTQRSTLLRAQKRRPMQPSNPSRPLSPTERRSYLPAS